MVRDIKRRITTSNQFFSQGQVHSVRLSRGVGAGGVGAGDQGYRSKQVLRKAHLPYKEGGVRTQRCGGRWEGGRT